MKFLYVTGLVCLSMMFMGCEDGGGSGGGGGSSLTNEQLGELASTGTAMAQSMSNTAIGYEDTPPSATYAKSIDGQSMTGSFEFNNSNNYWEFSDSTSYSGNGSSFIYEYDFSVGLWEGNGRVETISSSLDMITMFGNVELEAYDGETGEDVTLNMSIGNGESNPFTWDGLGTTTITMDGTFTFDITYNNQAVSMTMTFSSLSIDTSSDPNNTYPTGSITVSGNAEGRSFSGTIVYNGTSTATATINGETSQIDLDDAAMTTVLQ